MYYPYCSNDYMKKSFPRRGSNSQPRHNSSSTDYKYRALTDCATGDLILLRKATALSTYFSTYAVFAEHNWPDIHWLYIQYKHQKRKLQLYKEFRPYHSLWWPIATCQSCFGYSIIERYIWPNISYLFLPHGSLHFGAITVRILKGFVDTKPWARNFIFTDNMIIFQNFCH